MKNVTKTRKASAREIARLMAAHDQAEAAAQDALRRLLRLRGGRTKAGRAACALAAVEYARLEAAAQLACDELFQAEHGFHPSERQWADA